MCNDDKFDENLPPPFFVNNDPSSIKSKKFERLIRLSFAETFSLTVSETVIISIGGRGGSRMSGMGGLNNVRGGWAIARWTTLFNAIISQLHLTSRTEQLRHCRPVNGDNIKSVHQNFALMLTGIKDSRKITSGLRENFFTRKLLLSCNWIAEIITIFLTTT